jgi:tRNA-uridine 2-sulfurtransferase
MKRILVWLSGGVDSAVAAYLLMQQGFDVTGGYMINYTTDDETCTTKADLVVAKQVADFLGIKLHTFDFQQEYHDRVVTYIVNSYRDGLTPNPDVMCNSEVKFKLFLEEWIAMGFDAVATWHYARVISKQSEWNNTSSWAIAKDLVNNNIITSTQPVILNTFGKLSAVSVKNPEYTSRAQDQTVHWIWQDPQLTTNYWLLTTSYQLLKWIDPNKDQSYFLSWLNQDQLSKAMFPLWWMTKPEVRQIALEANLPNANRKDSQWICFIGKVPMKQFLEQYIPKRKWNIIDTTGRILGEHDWAWWYTIGQRKWLWVAAPEPLFVVDKDIENNTITVGYENEAQLYSHDIHIKNFHRIWQQYQLPFTGHAKIRYRQADQEMTLSLGTRDKELGTRDSNPSFWVASPSSWVITKDFVNNNEITNYELWVTSDTLTAYFTEPQRAVASGQIVVVYDWEVVVGSWVII